MRMVECQQGTAEWHAARLGVITASRFKDACARLAAKPERRDRDGAVLSVSTPGLPTAKALLYASDVALERVTGLPGTQPFITQEMRIGSEREPFARGLYEARMGAWVTEAGIALTDDGEFGYSTDGFVGDDGCIEIKCPSSADVIVSMWSAHDLSDYLHQIQGGLWLTGRKWCDFVMYVPSLRDVGKDLYVRRVPRDEAFIETMESQLMEFRAIVQANVAALTANIPMESGRVQL